MRIVFDQITFDPKHDLQCPECLTFNVGLISGSNYCLGCGEKIKPLPNPDGGVADVIDLQDFKTKIKNRKEKRKAEFNECVFD